MTDKTIRTEGDWTLAYNNGNLEARKPVPYDGMLRYTTESRQYTHGKNSRYNLTPREVVKEFVRNARPGDTISDILAEVTA